MHLKAIKITRRYSHPDIAAFLAPAKCGAAKSAPAVWCLRGRGDRRCLIRRQSRTSLHPTKIRNDLRCLNLSYGFRYRPNRMDRRHGGRLQDRADQQLAGS
jgi:hypothetical protein